MPDPSNRSQRLDRAISDLLNQAPEVEAAAVVSFDGLPMASALPSTMDEDRVAAMSAALLSLGERAAEGLGRGGLNQVYIEGDTGTVFLVSCDDEAVLVAVAAKGAKVGMMLYEVRRAADAVAEALRNDDRAAAEEAAAAAAAAPAAPAAAPVAEVAPAPLDEPYPQTVVAPTPEPAGDTFLAAPIESAIMAEPVAEYAPMSPTDPAWAAHQPTTAAASVEPPVWS